MVPKEEMIVLDMTSSIEDALRVVQKTGHSRFPIEDRAKSDIYRFYSCERFDRINGRLEKRVDQRYHQIRLLYFGHEKDRRSTPRFSTEKTPSSNNVRPGRNCDRSNYSGRYP